MPDLPNPTQKPDAVYDTPAPDPAWPRPWMGDFLAALAKYPTGTGRANVRRACREAGISDTLAHNVRKADERFAAAWEEAKRAAKETAHESLNDLLFGWASTGMPVREVTITTNQAGEVLERREKTGTVRSPTVAIFLAKKWMPEIYGDQPIRVESTGLGGGPIELRVTEEESDAAIGAFDATVVRLADARRARDSAERSGTG